MIIYALFASRTVGNDIDFASSFSIRSVQRWIEGDISTRQDKRSSILSRSWSISWSDMRIILTALGFLAPIQFILRLRIWRTLEIVAAGIGYCGLVTVLGFPLTSP